LAVRTDGTLWAWGQNNNGQLGLGDTTGRTSPTQVGTDTNWASVSTGGITAGGNHSLGVRTDGTLWAWDNNGQGRLGLGDTTNRTSPTQVGTDADWADVAAGNHSLGLRTDGDVVGLGEQRERSARSR
jgi:alpha-tubulin suppressor-like RCC1 family protein